MASRYAFSVDRERAAFKVDLAKKAMRLFERRPRKNSLGLTQIFSTDDYRAGTPEAQRALRRASSNFRKEHEAALPFERHFHRDLRPYIEGKTFLDLGCFTGGRTVAWHKRYNARKSYGIDVDPLFIQAGAEWAAEEGVDSDFRLAFGERLPFEDCSFDAIMTFDVLEHVRSVERTMAECLRVLRPGGVLIAVFPPFYCPTEHHLSCVSMTPALHWIFDGETLFEAYRQIIRERGDDWYAPGKDRLCDWEKLFTLNGVTVSSFLRIVDAQGWQREYFGLPLWPATIRRIATSKFLRTIWRALSVVNHVPGLRELATDRVCAILRKP